MSLPLILGIIIWIVLGSIIEAVVADNYGEDVISTPKVLYDNTKMNWFGCWFGYILLRIISPLVTIFGVILITICCIFSFIGWLFTIGRR